MSKNLKVVSLFSGCGGLDLGFIGGFQFRETFFKKTGFEVVFSNDIDSDAVKTYLANPKFFPKHQVLQSDIRKVNVQDIPDFDVLLAGFPCQPFSNAGNRKGINDANGRGTLFYECERVIKEVMERTNGKLPKAFVFENVRGIMSSKTDDGKTVPEAIQSKMEALGFNVSMKLLRTSDYGVPQNRHRFIIVGIRNNDPPFSFEALNRVVQDYNLPTTTKNSYELTLGSILSDISDDIPQNMEYWKYSPQGQSMVDMIGSCEDGAIALNHFLKKTPLDLISPTIQKGRSWKNISPDKLPIRFKKIYDDPKKYHAPNFYRRFALGEIAGTITASAQPENCGITHPFENRRFSIREIARIQSFPDDFIFPYSSISNAYKVIGNAVPPIFAWVLATALKNYFDERNQFNALLTNSS